MKNRLELQTLLESILGSENVYYQPPETIKINYPAIIYSRADIPNIYADNDVYAQNIKYRVTVVDKNPDSIFVTEVSRIPTCRFERHYTNDNLNHDSFIVYY